MRSTEVVVIGSGFGGLAAAKQLAKSNVETVLISATAEHLFQPLLYQVATGVLPAQEIAPQIAEVLADKESISVVEGYVTALDARQKVLTYSTADGVEQIAYEYLIVAAGASQGYFGHDEWADCTFSLKTRADAVDLRAHLLDCFEAPANDDAAHTFVVVGAGATGVEVAGQIQELGNRYFTDAPATVHLVEGAGDVLPVYGGKLSAFARKTLEKSGIDVMTGTVVTDIQGEAVTVRTADGDDRVLRARTVVWSAGVKATPLAAVVAEATGCDTDRAGRLLINPDLTVGGRADVFAIGDMTSLDRLPGQSPVAMQQGRHAADMIRGTTVRGTRFRYLDKGSMAVVNRHNAVVDAPFGIKLTGFLGWLTWLGVHLFYLVGFRNRVGAVLSWFRSFAGKARPGFAQVDRRSARPEEPDADRANSRDMVESAA
ncbi:NAD(P)/FAD-dependent oxidoreductase [Gordonia neofelifaecis]|uniref:FAD-dependent pyridine nucleotide-disulfide oxidoreductase n=1 Tax=Gordonia neofelifaecis NRRL B-59395 TaxID=644548 RepID=F1YHT9_9ACTN|nr:NAD(P)/FAD-dependent oxidoreductase [Gordonia neofelifaecis]EGD55493.1 FAD-dependent pyridine nucleotide-disulfide oxidoreductase [Gordonia neofelifaecis NRRL B-59395]